MNLVGIDIGGTNVRIVLVDETGHVTAQESAPTLAERGAERSIGTIIERVRGVLSAASRSRPDAIGIGITGPVDPKSGIVSNPYTLAGWPPTDIRTPFADAFAVPVVVDNDANVAAVGEWWIGAGQDSKRLAVVTIGTGIGAAMLVGGRISGHRTAVTVKPVTWC
jgi:glucokinase